MERSGEQYWRGDGIGKTPKRFGYKDSIGIWKGLMNQRSKNNKNRIDVQSRIRNREIWLRSVAVGSTPEDKPR
jgi:hypothetical protein